MSLDPTVLPYYRGRVALTAILNGLSDQRRRRVVTQAFTCQAVSEGILAAGRIPLYVDIDMNTGNLDPNCLADVLDCHDDIGAIVVQHTFGIPADVTAILDLADKSGIPIIEDCCHTLTSAHCGIRVGSFGVAAFTSLEWGKQLVAGIGGLAIINDEGLAERVRAAHSQLVYPGRFDTLKVQAQYFAHRLIFRPSLYWPIKSLFHYFAASGLFRGNYNPISHLRSNPEFRQRMAPVIERRARGLLFKLENESCRRRTLEQRYRIAFSDLQVDRLRPLSEDVAVMVRLPIVTGCKERLLALAAEHRVEVADWYRTPVHPLEGKQLKQVGYEPGACPLAEKLCKRLVTFPLHTKTDVRQIARSCHILQAAHASP